MSQSVKTLDTSKIEEFSSQLRGKIIQPLDEEYLHTNRPSALEHAARIIEADK